MNVSAFLLALPLAVWSLAALFAVIDGPDLAGAIRSICLRIAAILAYVAIFGSAGHSPLLWAFAVVGALHVSTSLVGRWLIARGTLITKSDP